MGSREGCGASWKREVLIGLVFGARNKEALVSEYMDRSSPHTLWNFNFMRDVHDRKIESLDSFLTLLYSMNPRSGARG
jgi:hypothetical protein